MAQRATITINDRETTPVAHAYVPNGGASDDVAYFRRAASVPIGDEVITVTNKFSNGKYRIGLLLKFPTLVTETVNGVSVPKVPRTAYAEVRLTFDETSTLQERKNVVGLLYNALASSQTMLDATFTGLEKVY